MKIKQKNHLNFVGKFQKLQILWNRKNGWMEFSLGTHVFVIVFGLGKMKAIGKIRAYCLLPIWSPPPDDNKARWSLFIDMRLLFSLVGSDSSIVVLLPPSDI